MSSNSEERRMETEIRRQLGLIRDKLESVRGRIVRIEVERIRNWKASSPSAEFDMQCQAELEECKEQERELKERFNIQSEML